MYINSLVLCYKSKLYRTQRKGSIIITSFNLTLYDINHFIHIFAVLISLWILLTESGCKTSQYLVTTGPWYHICTVMEKTRDGKVLVPSRKKRNNIDKRYSGCPVIQEYYIGKDCLFLVIANRLGRSIVPKLLPIGAFYQNILTWIWAGIRNYIHVFYGML